jgi:alkylhydroperoxidase family enzyme
MSSSERDTLDPMFLRDVEAHQGTTGHFAAMIQRARGAGMPFPQIWHLFAFKPAMTQALSAFTHAVMRGPSPLAPGLRELIAAFTSRKNQCLF